MRSVATSQASARKANLGGPQHVSATDQYLTAKQQHKKDGTMSHIPQLVSRTQAYGDWLFSADLEALDNAALAADDHREQIERQVTFDDLMELLVELTAPQKNEFMVALARGNKDDLHTIHTLLTDAKEIIVKSRLAGGV
jgi:hypothetical protein